MQVTVFTLKIELNKLFQFSKITEDKSLGSFSLI